MRSYEVRPAGILVSILVFMEVARRGIVFAAYNMEDVWFQSLFLWKSLVENKFCA